jgi:hypothetical protein
MQQTSVAELHGDHSFFRIEYFCGLSREIISNSPRLKNKSPPERGGPS